MASAKFANNTVNQSHTAICTENPMPGAPVNTSRIRNTVVSAAPTSTTNITGFFNKVTGFNLTKHAFAARRTISGSNNGRARTSFLGSNDVGSLCGSCGGAVMVDMI